LTGRIDKLEGSSGDALQQELALLMEKLAAQRAREFGPSSERKGKGTGSKDEPSEPRTGHGPTPQPNLEVIEEHFQVTEPGSCDVCGGVPADWPGQVEESEEITVVERKFILKKILKHKARCQCGTCIVTADGPPKVITGGRYSLEFATAIAVQKYLYHLPLARQERWMVSNGLTVTRQTLWDQIDALASHLEPTYQALLRYVLTAPVVGADETTWPMLEGKKKWWAWAVGRPDAIYYMISPTRSHKAAAQLLKEFAGTVMTDGYAAYGTLRKARKSIGKATFVWAACWAHVRRKYVHCEADYPDAEEAVRLIGLLFSIDREVTEQEFASEEEQLAELGRQRATKSRAVLSELRQWRTDQRPLEKSSFGRALTYMDNLWTRLVIFIDDPMVPLTNNLIERGMRGPAIGRRNHYGSKSRRGTQVAALMYSLLETCKLVDVNPEKYLETVTRRAILTPGAVLLPHEYAAEIAASAAIESTESEKAA
jgi:transposase